MNTLNRICLAMGLTALVAWAGLIPTTAQADTIRLNDGTELEGTIVLEADDFVKIEMQATSTIKESKMVKRSDIKEVVKTAPDETAWEALQKLIPTRSLISAGEYNKMIDIGPKDFLRKFPESSHKEEVSEILTTLKLELDKVERGFRKIEGEWYSMEDRGKFTMYVEAKQLYLAMKNQAGQTNIHSYVQAMRTFQDIDENHYGSPAHAQAVLGAKKLLPVLGQTATRYLQDVTARNNQFERDKELLSPGDKAIVLAARAREDMIYKANLAADKEAKIKWVRVNISSTESLADMQRLVQEEIDRLAPINANALAARAGDLYNIDKKIANGDLIEAKSMLSKIEILPEDGNVSKSSKRPPTSLIISNRPKSYYMEVKQKLDAKFVAILRAEEAVNASKESASVVAGIKTGSEKLPVSEKTTEDGAATTGTKTEAGATEAGEKDDTPERRRSVLGGISEGKTVGKNEQGKGKSKSNSKSKAKDDDKEKERPVVATTSSFTLPSWGIPAIIAVVLGGVIGALKLKEKLAGATE